jgi:hypothetical protein
LRSSILVSKTHRASRFFDLEVTHLPFLAMGKLLVYVLTPRQPKLIFFNHQSRLLTM